MQSGNPEARDRLERFWIGIITASLSLVLLLSGPVQSQDISQAAPSYVERDSIRVVYWGNAERLALQTLAAALSPLPLPGIPSVGRSPPSTIFLAPTSAVFDSLTQGAAPSWAAGVAIPSLQAIVLPAYRRPGQLGDPVVTLRHEIAHLALSAYLSDAAPRWFEEGYATWVSGGWDERSGWQIRVALLGGNLPPLASLTLDWPRDEGPAQLSYLLSASAVRHLAVSRGDAAFSAFLREMREVGDFDPALRNVYLLTASQFEREWRTMVRRRYGWLLALSQMGIFWIGLLLLVALLGSGRRKRNRERMEELRREEYMLPPGDPPALDPIADPD